MAAETQYHVDLDLPLGLDWDLARQLEQFGLHHLADVPDFTMRVKAEGPEVEVNGDSVREVRDSAYSSGSVVQSIRVSISSLGNPCMVAKLCSEKSLTKSYAWFEGKSEVTVRGLAAALERFLARDSGSDVASPMEVIELANRPGTENVAFSTAELSEIAELLHSVNEHLRNTAALTEGELSLIADKLSYLEEAAHRQGKKDWIHTAIGVVATISVGVGLAPDQARALGQLLSQGLRALGTG